MENKTFKLEIGSLLKKTGLEKGNGFWFKKEIDLIIVVHLQKSDYSNYFYFIVKVYIQCLFGDSYKIDKSLVNNLGTIRIDPFIQNRELFDLDNNMNDEERMEKISKLIAEKIVPLIDRLSSIEGIKKMITDEGLYATEAVKTKLGI